MRRPPFPSRRPARPAPRRRAAGFTLIEMVVVMTLIALLLTLAIPRYFAVIDNGRLSVQRQNLSTVRDAIDKFYGDVGRYPDTLEELVTRRYLRAIPVDPVSESADWVVLPPPDADKGVVFDIQPSGRPAGGGGTR